MSNIFLNGVDYDVAYKTETSSKQVPSKISDVFKIIYVIQGTIDYWVGSKYYKLYPKDILIIPKEEMMGGNIKVKNDAVVYFDVWVSDGMLTHLKDEDEDTIYLFEQAKSKGQFSTTLDADMSDSFCSMLEKCIEESTSKRLNAHLMSKAMLYLSLITINRSIFEKNDGRLKAGQNKKLSNVIEYIKANCTQTLTVEGLAKKFGYSESNLAHSFKKHIGTSLYHYILLCRLQIGRQCILEGMPIKEAYERCGFGDYAGFYRAFTKEFNISPQKYKKKYQTQ